MSSYDKNVFIVSLNKKTPDTIQEFSTVDIIIEWYIFNISNSIRECPMIAIWNVWLKEQLKFFELFH